MCHRLAWKQGGDTQNFKFLIQYTIGLVPVDAISTLLSGVNSFKWKKKEMDFSQLNGFHCHLQRE